MLLNKIKRIIIAIKKSLVSYFTVSSSLLIARLLSGLCSVLIARSLTVSEFAVFSTAFFVMTILGQSTTGIDKAFVFQYVIGVGKEKDFVLRDFIYLKLLIWLVFSFLSVLLFFTFEGNYDFKFSTFGIGVVLSLAFWILTFISSIYQAQKNFRLLGLTNVIYSVALFFLILILFFLKNKNMYFYLSSYFVSSILLILLVLPFKGLHLYFRFADVFKLLGKSKWMLCAEVIWLLFIRLDYFNLIHILSETQLGSYAVSLRIMNIIVVLVASLSFYILPKAADIKTPKDLKNFWMISFVIGFSLMFIYLILFLGAGLFIPLVFGKEYAPAIDYLRIMIGAYLPLVFLSPLKYIILRLDKEIFYFLFNLILIVVYLILLFPLIKVFQDKGPVIAKGIGFFSSLMFGVFIYNVYKKQLIGKLSAP